MLLLAIVALAAPPSGLSEEEWAELEAGQVVVRADTSGADTVSTGYVLVAKPKSALWGDVLDLKARIPENGTLKMVHEYKRVSPYEFFVQIDMRVFGSDVRFTNHYVCTPDVCRYTLDPALPNDLELADGYYQIDSVSAERSLLTYHSRSRHHIRVPGWVRKWLAVDAVENLLAKLKSRAEQRASN